MDPALFRGGATRTPGVHGRRGGPNGAFRKGSQRRGEAGARAWPRESQRFPLLTTIYQKFPEDRGRLGGAQPRDRGEAEEDRENEESSHHLGPRPGWFGLGPGEGLLGGGWPWPLSPYLGPCLGPYLGAYLGPSLGLSLSPLAGLGCGPCLLFSLVILAGLRLVPLLSYGLGCARPSA